MKIAEGIHIMAYENGLKAYLYDKDGSSELVSLNEVSKVAEVVVNKLDAQMYEQIKDFKIKELHIVSSLIEVSDISALQVKKISNHSVMGTTFNDRLVVPADIKLPKGIKLSNPIVFLPSGYPVDHSAEVTDLDSFQTDADTVSHLTAENIKSLKITYGEIKSDTLSGIKEIEELTLGEKVIFADDSFICPPCQIVTFKKAAPETLVLSSAPKEISFGGKVPSSKIAASGVLAHVNVNNLTQENVKNLEGYYIGQLVTPKVTADDISSLRFDYLGSVRQGQIPYAPMIVPADIKFPKGNARQIIGNYIVKERD